MHSLLITKFPYWKWNIGGIENFCVGKSKSASYIYFNHRYPTRTTWVYSDWKWRWEFNNNQSNTEEIQKQNLNIKKEVIDQEGRSFIFNSLIDNIL